jgi:hypothetical protein
VVRQEATTGSTRLGKSIEVKLITKNWGSRATAARCRERAARRPGENKVHVARLHPGLDPAPHGVVCNVLIVGVQVDNVAVGDLDAHCLEIRCQSVRSPTGPREEMQDAETGGAGIRVRRVAGRVVCHEDGIGIILGGPMVHNQRWAVHELSILTAALALSFATAAALATIAALPA